MGGGYTRGNVTPVAEFNIYVDPEAAAIVFRADWDVTMVGLDLTHQALATAGVQAADRRRSAPGRRGSSAALTSSPRVPRRQGSTTRPCMTRARRGVIDPSLMRRCGTRSTSS